MNIYLLLAILSCLPMVFVLVFMLVPASWRWAGTGLSLTGLGTIVSFEQEALGPAIFALAMSLVVIGTRHFEAVIGDIAYREENGLPPLMRDKWGINAWFNPIWFLIYLRRMIRDADFQRELAEPGAYYDVTGPFRTLFAKLRR